MDANGEELNKNNLLAIAAYIAANGETGKTIVTDSITSDGFKTFIEKDMGCHHHRFVRGYKNVINEAIRLNEENNEDLIHHLMFMMKMIWHPCLRI